MGSLRIARPPGGRDANSDTVSSDGGVPSLVRFQTAALSSVPRLCLLSFSLVVASCRSDASGPIHVREGQFEVLVKMPNSKVLEASRAPDGTLFVGTVSELYRFDPRTASAQHVANMPAVVVDLAAINQDATFAIFRGSSSLFRWSASSDWVSYSLPSLGPRASAGTLLRLSALDDGRAMAVGTDGLTLRLEDETLFLDSRSVARTLWGVAMSLDRDIAVSFDRVFEREGTAWVPMKDQPALSTFCGLHTALVTGRSVIVTGGEEPCLHWWTESGWNAVEVKDILGHDEMIDGEVQARGLSALWGRRGSILLLPEATSRFELYRLDDVRPLGVMVLGESVYVVGNRSDAGVIGRFNRR